jgi:hypothetical protein
MSSLCILPARPEGGACRGMRGGHLVILFVLLILIRFRVPALLLLLLLTPNLSHLILLFSYTKAHSVIYDSGSFPRSAIFSPRETSRAPLICVTSSSVVFVTIASAGTSNRGTSLIRNSPTP